MEAAVSDSLCWLDVLCRRMPKLMQVASRKIYGCYLDLVYFKHTCSPHSIKLCYRLPYCLGRVEVAYDPATFLKDDPVRNGEWYEVVINISYDIRIESDGVRIQYTFYLWGTVELFSLAKDAPYRHDAIQFISLEDGAYPFRFSQRIPIAQCTGSGDRKYLFWSYRVDPSTFDGFELDQRGWAEICRHFLNKLCDDFEEHCVTNL